jgi:chorismate mutase-like protein
MLKQLRILALATILSKALTRKLTRIIQANRTTVKVTDEKKLGKLREQIDTIDGKLLELISARAQCAREVAEVKGGDANTVYYRPEREAQVLRHIMA